MNRLSLLGLLLLVATAGALVRGLMLPGDVADRPELAALEARVEALSDDLALLRQAQGEQFPDNPELQKRLSGS